MTGTPRNSPRSLSHWHFLGIRGTCRFIMAKLRNDSTNCRLSEEAKAQIQVVMAETERLLELLRVEGEHKD